MKKFIIGATLLAVIAGIGGAYAASTITVPADDVIAARQAGMELQIALAGSIKRAIDAKLDVKPFKDAGNAFAGWGQAIPGLFVPGTAEGHHTRALPVIWTERADFEKAAANLTTAGHAMAQAAEAGDQAAFADSFQAVGKACTACHRTYRAR